jgi:hypothetical protein
MIQWLQHLIAFEVAMIGSRCDGIDEISATQRRRQVLPG